MQTKSTMSGTVQSPESEVEEIQITIESARETVAKRDNLLKLAKNRQFKEMIMEGYLKEEAIRLTQISARIEHKEYRDEIADAIKAISHFQQWMDRILTMGDMAETSILEHEKALQDAFELEELEG